MKRCSDCKHFLASNWNHRQCRGCRKARRVEKKLSDIGAPPRIIITSPQEYIVGPKEKCPQCGVFKQKAEVKTIGRIRPCLACYKKNTPD